MAANDPPYPEKEYYFQREVLRQSGPSGAALEATLQRIFAGNPSPGDVPYFEKTFSKIREDLIGRLRTLKPGEYTSNDLVLVMTMIEANVESTERVTDSLSKIIPLEAFEKGLAADYNKPYQKDVNAPISLTGSFGRREDSEGLSVAQLASRFGLKYQGTPYYVLGKEIVQVGNPPQAREVDVFDAVLAVQPFAIRVDVPEEPGDLDRLKLPIDPLVLDGMVKLADMDPYKEPDPTKRADLEAQQAFAAAFLTRNLKRLTLVPRLEVPAGMKANEVELPAATKTAMASLTARFKDLSIGKASGLEPPFTGHTAAGEFGSDGFTSIGSEFYLPADKAIQLRPGTQISLIQTNPDAGPYSPDKPAGMSIPIAVMNANGGFERTLSDRELDTIYKQQLALVTNQIDTFDAQSPTFKEQIAALQKKHPELDPKSLQPDRLKAAITTGWKGHFETSMTRVRSFPPALHPPDELKERIQHPVHGADVRVNLPPRSAKRRAAAAGSTRKSPRRLRAR